MRWGNSVSVLAGDFVLIRALEEVLRSGIPGAMPALLETIHSMIAGEALQLSLRGRGDACISDYVEVVEGKTAALFAFCGRAGALCAGAAAGPGAAAATASQADVLAGYARHLGQAFQIVDDVLDIDGDPAELGKAVLSDLREGKLTLPVLLALEAKPELRERIQLSVLGPSDDSLPEPTVALLRAALADSDATRRARHQAAREAELGCTRLAALPAGPYRDALWHVADELVQRNR
jgi:octaprenyl-diphosphate synthase